MTEIIPLSKHPTLMALRAEFRRRGELPKTDRELCSLEISGLLGLCIQSHTYEGDCPATPERMETAEYYIEQYRQTGELPKFVEEVSKEIIGGGRARLAPSWVESFCLMTETCDAPIPA